MSHMLPSSASTNLMSTEDLISPPPPPPPPQQHFDLLKLPPELQSTILQTHHPPWPAQVIIHKTWGANNTFPFTVRSLDSLSLLLTSQYIRALTIKALRASYSGVLDLTECSPARFLTHVESSRGLLGVIAEGTRVVRVPDNIMPDTVRELRELLPRGVKVEVNVLQTARDAGVRARVEGVARNFKLEDFLAHRPEVVRAVDDLLFEFRSWPRLTNLQECERAEELVLKTWVEIDMKRVFGVGDWREGDILRVELQGEGVGRGMTMVEVGFGKTPLRQMMDAFRERRNARRDVLGAGQSEVDLAKLRIKDCE